MECRMRIFTVLLRVHQQREQGEVDLLHHCEGIHFQNTTFKQSKWMF